MLPAFEFVARELRFLFVGAEIKEEIRGAIKIVRDAGAGKSRWQGHEGSSGARGNCRNELRSGGRGKFRSYTTRTMRQGRYGVEYENGGCSRRDARVGLLA